MPTYKVVEIKHRKLFKQMSALDLQNTINEHATDGWALDRIMSGETAAFLGVKDVFLLVFRKES
ncbi:MAG: DUF4177 domain-containing protein [Thermodesulfobacteriota bacterium]